MDAPRFYRVLCRMKVLSEYESKRVLSGYGVCNIESIWFLEYPSQRLPFFTHEITSYAPSYNHNSVPNDNYIGTGRG